MATKTDGTCKCAECFSKEVVKDASLLAHKIGSKKAATQTVKRMCDDHIATFAVGSLFLALEASANPDAVRIEGFDAGYALGAGLKRAVRAERVVKP